MSKKKHRSNSSTWVRVIAFGLIIVFIGGYVLQSIFTLDMSSNSSSAQKDNVTHINIPFKMQGVVNIREAQPGGATLYSGNIEIADTDGKRAQGLMYRDSLAPNQGMLFIFPKEEMQSFWMKNTRISLDIIYINDSGRIVSIVHEATPMDETSRPSLEPARYVLEVPGGTCYRNDIKKGCMVEWIRTDE